MKSDIESSKEFRDSLKRAKDKNPACKIKPRVTAQSRGTVTAYKGVFPALEEAEEADGKEYYGFNKNSIKKSKELAKYYE